MVEEQLKKIDILVVDDDLFILEVAGSILKKNYSIVTAKSGQEALKLLEEYAPRLILLDIYMPGLNGQETMEKIYQNDAWKKIPIIFLTSDTKPETENECLMLGASDFITKPFVPAVMLSRIGRIIELYELRNELEIKLEEKSWELEKVSLNSIMAIAHTIDAKDVYTAGHSVRVAKCAAEIAKRLGWSETEVQNIHYMALLHDIGKIGVPDTILNKPVRLSEEEFVLIRRHPVIGNEILKDIHSIKDVAVGALYHHERYDGKGYPYGLKGEEIPLCARIIGIADTYDAMTSNRIYRAKLSDQRVIEEFEKGIGTQFDPELAELFLSMLREGFQLPEEKRRRGDNSRNNNAQSSEDVMTESDSGMSDKESVDAHTGVNNRSYGEDHINMLLEERHNGALLLIDVDNFLGINDTYGHLVGDRVLRLLAETLIENSTAEDVVCRTGGDEFLLFLTNVIERKKIRQKAQDILAAFSNKMRDINCGNLSSLSIGIAVSPADGKNFSALYDNGDKALYHVKKSGKNAYAFFSEEGEGQRMHETGMDLDHIRCLIEGRMDKSPGAFQVDYNEFQKLYSYISRYVKRDGRLVQTLLFTLNGDGRRNTDDVLFEEAMNALEVAVASSLRMVDVGNRYSSVQYIVILMDTTLENGKKVAERVSKQFYRIYGGSYITLSYDIQSMTAGGSGEE